MRRTRDIPNPAALLVLASTAAALTGCADDESLLEPAFGATEQEIVAGSINNGDPAVVALTAGGQQFCTGTLIRQDVVLTAAHCLPPNLGFVQSYSQIDVFFGTQVPNGQFIPAIDGWTHLGWNDQEFLFDIGLLRLSQPAAVAPIPFRTTPVNNGTVGEPVRIAGFGITQNGANNSGTKRVANTQVSQVYQGVFEMFIQPSGTCSGDSGGPAFITVNGEEQVAGVHSRSDCVNSAIETTVPSYLDEIYAFLGENPQASCDADGQCATMCAAPDPDCLCATDGFCTDQCIDNATDADCGTLCAADANCNMDCPANFPDPDCQGGSCEADGMCNQTCAADPDCTTGQGGGACTADGFCDANCASPDPDCWTSGVEEEDYNTIVGGCSVPKPGERDTDARYGLLFAAAGLLLTRRRR